MNKQKEHIDKFKVILNNTFINLAMIKKKNIDPKNRLTLHRFGDRVALAIHGEWFNLQISFKENVASAIYELVKIKYLDFPNKK